MRKKKEIYGKKEHLKKRKTNEKTCDNIDVNEIEHFKKKDNKRKKEKCDNLVDNEKEHFKKDGNKRKKEEMSVNL